MITVIDYNSGNIASVCNALKKLGKECRVSSDANEIAATEKVIFPGVGRAAFAMDQLRKLGLIDVIRNLEVPFLGICLGLQLLSDFSQEDDARCMGIIPGDVKKFNGLLQIPQIGWNKVEIVRDSPLFNGIESDNYFYFVNSYCFEGDEEFVIARTDYGRSFDSAIWKDNFYATQFHPEKSGEVGLQLLNNFCELC